MPRFRWWYIPLVACLAVTFLCGRFIYLACFGYEYEVAAVSLRDGYTIYLWEAMDGLSSPSFDFDHSNPSIYWGITQNGEVLITKRYLTNKFTQGPFQIQVAFADENSLVAVYDTERWVDGVYILFDVEHPELIELRGSEYIDWRQVWNGRYERLKAENPDLPGFYFEDTA